MLIRPLLGAIIMLTGACGAPAQPAPASPDAVASSDAEPGPSSTASSQALADIEAFFENPSLETARPVMRFTRDSEDVLVVFRAAFTQDDAANDDQKTLMMAAFAAGNVRAQLQGGTKGDAPAEGVRGVLELYKRWKEAQPDLSFTTLEAFARAEADGTLEQAVAQAIEDGG